jgi:hypothetical protein
MPKNTKEIMIEDARIVFPNFAGKEGMYNTEGDRNFSVILPEDVAEQMLEDGWNVKRLKIREDDEDRDVGDPYIQISVSFKVRPPHVVAITSTKRTNLSEDTIDMLDWAEFENVDLIANPYHWDVNGKTGIKAYLKSMYVTIKEDPLELKYAAMEADGDIPEEE